MIITFEAIRQFADRGGSLVFRLVVERQAYEGAGSVTVSCTAPSYSIERTWNVRTYNLASSTKKVSTDVSVVDYSGTVTDTVTFTGAGIAVYDITDHFSPVRTPDIPEVTAYVNGSPFTAHGYATGDDFDRTAALDGQLVLQKLLQASTTEDEEYLEDMLMSGWNFSTWLRWTEQLDEYVTALRTPEADPAGSHWVSINTNTFGVALTTGDGKAFFTIPPQLHQYTLTSVFGALSAVSTSGIVTVQLANVTQGYDLLTTKLTIDANEFTSLTAATPAVIDTTASREVVNQGDLIRVDIDVAGTNAKDLQVVLGLAE